MTDKELDIIGHSLGVNVFHAMINKESLPKEYYRNYFQSDEGADSWIVLTKLVYTGLMTQREQFGMQVFHVSDKGKAEFKAQFEKALEG